MTIPYERTRSVLSTEDFLKRLAFEVKKLPKEVREEARRLLRHYPTAFDMAVTVEGHNPDGRSECPFAHPDEDFFGRKSLEKTDEPE
ncbi:MAG TPA: BPSL0761 family protein [Ignavibacteriaceae bacterium]